MKHGRVFAALILMLAIASCSTEITGEGVIIEETYSITTNVTKVSVDDDIDVTVKYGVNKKVHVTGYENLLNYVKISATGGVIRIGMKPDYTYQNMNISAIVEMPAITGITATHAGNIEIDTFDNEFSALALTTSGSGNITSLGKLDVGTLSINMSGSGIIYLQGTATTQTVQLNGSGDLNSFDMFVNSATVNNAGSGNIFVQVKNDLAVTIDSSGNISYKRYPAITSTITGSGLLINAN